MQNDEARMTFTEHLAELRKRIIVSLSVVFASVIVCFIFSEELFDVLRRPLAPLERAGVIANDVPAKGEHPAPTTTTPAPPPAEKPPESAPADGQWTALDPLEPIWVLLQISLYAGLFLSLPIVVYEVCAFVFPGLKPGERRVVNFMIFGCGGFALLGLLLAYFEILPTLLTAVAQWVPEGVVVQNQMSRVVSLIIKLMLAFAIAFQFPMLVFVLVYLELLSPAALRKQRRIAIVLLAIVAAVLTPGPDIISMSSMFIPLLVLFEFSLWGSYFIVWRKKKRALAAAAEG